jgi:3-deoxy-manno-octulosonate cytidylyltransferase (CMP-KDO synthetase)
MKFRVLAVIPARFESSRLPGKPLIKLGDREMILRVCDSVSKMKRISGFLVATDDQRIFDTVVHAGYSAMMTLSSHQSGTDRVAEVAQDRDDEFILNIQGDEPFLHPDVLDDFINQALNQDKKFDVGTLASPLKSFQEWQDPNIVKVVCDSQGQALYFSRSPIPYMSRERFSDDPSALKHVGVYLFPRDALFWVSKLRPSRLECLEKLEQLRVLENGGSIFVHETPWDSAGIDTAEDVKKAELAIRRSEKL